MRQPRTGVRFFACFSRIILESRVGPDQFEPFITKYGVRTGEGCRDHKSLITREGGWDYALDTKVYFDAPEWVIENLAAIGVHVLKGKKHRMFYVSLYPSAVKEPYQYSISNNEFFWWLVDYGYRLGENDPIPFPAQEKSCAV